MALHAPEIMAAATSLAVASMAPAILEEAFTPAEDLTETVTLLMVVVPIPIWVAATTARIEAETCRAETGMKEISGTAGPAIMKEAVAKEVVHLTMAVILNATVTMEVRIMAAQTMVPAQATTEMIQADKANRTVTETGTMGQASDPDRAIIQVPVAMAVEATTVQDMVKTEWVQRATTAIRTRKAAIPMAAIESLIVATISRIITVNRTMTANETEKKRKAEAFWIRLLKPYVPGLASTIVTRTGKVCLL